MKSREIREKFLDFFAKKEHEIVASAPMVIKDDPTLMFTNAGMNQFKDIFLGNSAIAHPRVADTQKCLRVSGKHNDLEEVGVDTYHHTMFEMLGNWSFGDYFKKEAIEWAWELLVDVYGLDPERLYATIFEGDKSDQLERDTEAEEIWKPILPSERILACDKKDNFWEMGETGPCGPCSEIHIDLRPEDERTIIPGYELVNKDHPQVIEIWNLVFMEFNRLSSGALVPLPNKHIDTGMGFERLVRAMQGKSSNYDTDIFLPIIRQIESATKTKYTGTDSQQDIAMRVISDHVRAVAFSICDGQLPSNTGAGYVIRRILRRAVRYGFSFLNRKEPLLCELVSVLTAEMGSFFPELEKQKELIQKVIKEEEENFLRTLDKGIGRLNEIMADSGKVIDGAKIFELYDTYGFPLDLTALIAGESGKEVDTDGFQSELEKQKERSRAAGKIQAGDWVELREDKVEEFVGYDRLETEIHITRYRKVVSKGKERFHLVFDLTPFYPEGGGQVGDKGYIQSEKEKIHVANTLKENNLIIHVCDKLPEYPKLAFKGWVETDVRKDTERNHSATHLVHEALRYVLGDHVEQKGSLVDASHLRFDFSHFARMTEEEIDQVEAIVNSRIRENLSLQEDRAVPIAEAKKKGAMMLFGEKYDDVVRVIQFGTSIELCGGTHVKSSGEIGYFKIKSESAIAAGIRRIEAITGKNSENFINEKLDELDEVRELLKNPSDVKKAVNDLLEKNVAFQKQLDQVNREKAKDVKGDLKNKVKEVNGVNFIAERLDLGAAEVKDIAFQLRKEYEQFFAVFGSEANGKAMLTCVISDDLVVSKKLHAGAVIKELARSIEGGGGGQPFFATAGGKKAAGLDEALKNAINFIS